MVFFAGGDRDEEVEVALVCPAHALAASGEGEVVAKDDTKNKKKSFLRTVKNKFEDETFRCVSACFVLTLVLGGVVLSYFFCPVCLIGIIVISACMAPYEAYWNIPLWVSMLLVILFGITIVNRDVAVIWRKV